MKTGDIYGPEEIRLLVDTFYAKVQRDEQLGPLFNEVAKVDWEEHLPKLYAFWEGVLFGTSGFRGNPMLVHHELDQKVPLEWPLFERWLFLFHETTDELFVGPMASKVKAMSSNMGRAIYSRLQAMRGFPPTGGAPTG